MVRVHRGQSRKAVLTAYSLKLPLYIGAKCFTALSEFHMATCLVALDNDSIVLRLFHLDVA